VDSESAWLAGHLLARAIARHGNDDVEGVRNAVLRDELIRQLGGSALTPGIITAG